MHIEKTKLCDMPMVYVTAELTLGGRRYLASATEAPGGRAVIIDPETGETADLWQGDTGVMNIIQIPGREQLLAITRFYPVFQSQEAAVCLLTPTDKGYLSPWRMREVVRLPYCHRIGVIESENGLFLLGCQLCSQKDFTDDWSHPGALYTCPIPDREDADWTLTCAYEGLTQNHGLYIDRGSQVYICAKEGAFLFDCARYSAGEALIPKVLTTVPSSDICLAAIGGERIAGLIQPFHGDRLVVARLTGDTLQPFASYPIAFGHVVWVGELFGHPYAIAGSRAGETEALELIDWHTGERLAIEEKVGPTQITVFEQGSAPRILSANHGSGEVTLYTLSAD